MLKKSFIRSLSTLFPALWGMAMAVALLTNSAAAQGPAPDYDFDWVTIGNAGNRGYDGSTINSPYDNFPTGRGSVPYAYRMSRLEITSAQYVEFLNTFSTQSDELWLRLGSPVLWGGLTDLGYDGPGQRYILSPYPDADRGPVGGITWRNAALYCNWLHNGKSADPRALDTGAYDTSTWGREPNGGPYTDAERHMPGARFWIPTLDEHLKAAHYDPNKGGPGVDGWWEFNNRSDTAPAIGGAPGIGQTSAGTEDWTIPLGAYSQTTSAYGLLDLSGGASEWVEDINYWEGPRARNRFFEGAWVDAQLDEPGKARQTLDLARLAGSNDPAAGLITISFRIASVPPPSGVLCYASLFALLGYLRRRRL